MYENGLIVSEDTDWKKFAETSTKEDYVLVKVDDLYFVIDGDGDIKTSKKEYKAEDDDEVEYVYIDTTDAKLYTKAGAKKGSFTFETTNE